MGWDQWIRMVEIEPAISAASAVARERQIEALLRTGCRLIHLDGTSRDPLDAVGAISPLVHRYDGVLDVHAPGGGFSMLAAAGADSVTFDAALVGDPAAAIVEARGAGVQVGIAVEETMDPREVASFDVDLVSCACSAELGVGYVERVSTALANPTVIQVTGAVTHENLRRLNQAGASVFVVDDPIFDREDLPRAYRRLVQALA